MEKTTSLITSTLAGSLGAIIVLCLFYAFPVVAQEKRISASEFLLVNERNETVGRWGTFLDDGLPFLVLESVEKEGSDPKKSGSILIGFHEGTPQIRVHGWDRKGGVVVWAKDDTGRVAIGGKGAREVLRFDPGQAHTWTELTTSSP